MNHKADKATDDAWYTRLWLELGCVFPSRNKASQVCIDLVWITA